MRHTLSGARSKPNSVIWWGGQVLDAADQRRTVEPMAFDVAEALDSELSQYKHVDGLIEHVRRAVGADPAAEISQQVLIRAWVTRQSEAVFAVYALTDAAFVVAEMARSGETLSVWVDAYRIARVAEIVANGERIVTVEIDADVSRIVLEHEAVGAPPGEGDGYIERSNGVGRVIPASYEIRGEAGDAQLAWFSLQLRRNSR